MTELPKQYVPHVSTFTAGIGESENKIHRFNHHFIRITFSHPSVLFPSIDSFWFLSFPIEIDNSIGDEINQNESMDGNSTLGWDKVMRIKLWFYTLANYTPISENPVFGSYVHASIEAINFGFILFDSSRVDIALVMRACMTLEFSYFLISSFDWDSDYFRISEFPNSLVLSWPQNQVSGKT